ARFANPYGMIMMSDDGTRPDVIWLTDGNNYAIRQLDYNAGMDNYDVTTPVGVAGTSGYINDTGTAARFGDIRGIAQDATYAYIGDLGNLRIRRINKSSLVVDTFSGTGDAAYRLATLF